MTHVDIVFEQAQHLSPTEKAELVARLAQSLQTEISDQPKTLRKSMRGILAHLGPAPSAEDIDEVRREMLKNFPREDM